MVQKWRRSLCEGERVSTTNGYLDSLRFTARVRPASGDSGMAMARPPTAATDLHAQVHELLATAHIATRAIAADPHCSAPGLVAPHLAESRLPPCRVCLCARMHTSWIGAQDRTR